MVSVSDIVKLLEQIPLWKILTALPKRVAALEEKVARLEAALAARPAADACPKCGQPALQLEREERDRTFGPLGGKVRYYRCSACGFTTDKLVTS